MLFCPQTELIKACFFPIFLPPCTQGVKKHMERAGIEPRTSGSASDLFNKNLHWGFFHIHDSFQAYVYLQDQSTCSFRTFSSKFGTQVLAAVNQSSIKAYCLNAC